MNRDRQILVSDHQGFSFEVLQTDDIDEFIELQDSVSDSIPDKDLFVLTTRQECEESFVMDFCIGAFRKGQMAGASIMIINRDCERSLGAKLGYDPLKCVTLDTSFIRKDSQGNGLQRAFIKLRLNKARELGAEMAFATVAQNNIYSLANMRSYGFSILKKDIFYGGYERLVLTKKIRR